MSKTSDDAFEKVFKRRVPLHLFVRLLAALISLRWRKPKSLVCGDASCCPFRPNDSARHRLLTVLATGVRCTISKSRQRLQPAIFSSSMAPLAAAMPPTRLQTRQSFTKRKRLRVLCIRTKRIV
jgi:hypothetical protein